MRLLSILLVMFMILLVSAAPFDGSSVTTTSVVMPTSTSTSGDTQVAPSNATHVAKASPRFSCGQYKLSPGGVVQEFYSQVWAGLPADVPLCRYLKFEFGNKKGQMGNIVAAKVDYGCTCFFYEHPCDPSKGRTETWNGWRGWMNYRAFSKNRFQAWYCMEQN